MLQYMVSYQVVAAFSGSIAFAVDGADFVGIQVNDCDIAIHT